MPPEQPLPLHTQVHKQVHSTLQVRSTLRVHDMLQTMLQLQERHNIEVAADWRVRNLAFNRAIWVECAELLDHFGWKWWKHQRPDLGQVRLEIVDIWHFGLSCLMQDVHTDVHRVADAFMPLFDAGPDRSGSVVPSEELFRQCVEQLARDALNNTFSVPHFVALLQALPMSFQELFELYVGKNVLNRFRQANGYADGSYRKLWNGREDNVHLLEIAAQLRPEQFDYLEALHAALTARYAAPAEQITGRP